MSNNNENKLVPKLRFPEFKDVWNPEQLSNLLDYERPDNYIVKDTNYVTEGTPVLTANKSFILGYTQETFGICDNIPAIIFDDFTVDKKFVDFPFKVKSSAIKILRPKDKDDLKFLFELMSLIRFEAKEHKRYYISAYQNLSVPIPKPNEQQKIAACLSSLDEVITAESQKLEVLKDHKRGLLQNLLPVGKETIPKLRFKEFQNADEWNEDTLANIASFRRGSFPQPYGLPEWYDDENGMPFIQVFDVGEDFRLKSTTKRKISSLAAEQSVYIPIGTLIITIQGSIGRVAITQYDAYIDRTLLLFEEFYQEVDITFFAYTIFLLFEIEKQKAPGGIIKTITKEVLSSFVVKLPSIEEQQKIASCLTSLDELISAQTKKIEALQLHKKGLLQGLFPNVNEVTE